MAIILNKQQKQAYINMFEEETIIKELNLRIDEEWQVKESNEKGWFFLYIGDNYDDELTTYALELMGVRV